MIYSPVAFDVALDQGDLIGDCPVVVVLALAADLNAPEARFETVRVVVLTQTCDLANDKTSVATVAEVQSAQWFVDAGILGGVRSGLHAVTVAW